MGDSGISFLIGLMAGSIFFIDGWGPTEKSDKNEKKGFAESRRFRGLSVLIVGGIISPVLDYVSKNAKPDFFLAYLKGCIYGWFFVLLFGLLLYLFRSVTKQKNKEKFWYKAGEFAYSILDFVYLGISDNPHLNAKRKSDVTLAESIYKLEGDHKLKELEKKLLNADVKPNEMSEATKEIIQQYDEELKNIKKESEYTFEDWYYRGIAEYDKQEYEKAIVYMKNALEIDKNNLFAFNAILYIGISYDGLGLFNNAIEQYDKLIATYPNGINLYIIHYNKGLAYRKMNDNEKALKSYEDSLLLNPNYEFALDGKGHVLTKFNRYDESLKFFEDAIRNNPTFDSPWYNISCLYALMRNKEKMLFHLQKAIKLNIIHRDQAKTDEDFREFWNDEDFKKIIE